MSALPDPSTVSQIGQVLLRLQYRELARRAGALPAFSDVEFRCYSQNGEDGILLYLFSILGTTSRKAQGMYIAEREQEVNVLCDPRGACNHPGRAYRSDFFSRPRFRRLPACCPDSYLSSKGPQSLRQNIGRSGRDPEDERMKPR
jgi:hypothetical protein